MLYRVQSLGSEYHPEVVDLSIDAACHLPAVDELAPLIQGRAERCDLISQPFQWPEDLHRAIVDEMSLQDTLELISSE